MNLWLKALITATIFLTRLPMPQLATITPEDEGRSLVFFPLVGLIIGLLLCLLACVLQDSLSALVLAAVLTACWAALTGGLHLDGLADSADGWLGGVGDVERSLEIMHDPRCGSGAVVAVVCVLLMKFSALSIILQQQAWLALIIAPVIGRCVGPLLFIPGTFLYTPYVQPTGIAKNFIDHCPTNAPHIALIAVFACMVVLGELSMALMVLSASAVMLFLLRRLMLKNLGGATGDTAGAATEIIETVVLICCGTMAAGA
jgi:adenosylcobinamide-GDP ribazoletransferase